MARIKPSSTIAAATVYNNLSTIATLEINLIRQVPEALKIPVSDWAQNLWHCIFCVQSVSCIGWLHFDAYSRCIVSTTISKLELLVKSLKSNVSPRKFARKYYNNGEKMARKSQYNRTPSIKRPLLEVLFQF